MGCDNKKKRIYEIDFIRCISCLGIIAHHYCRELQNINIMTPVWFGGDYRGGNFGWFFVTLFLMISGMSMLENYPCVEKNDLKKFYLKRWVGIFPPFYLVWVIIYLKNVVLFHSFSYDGPLINLIWTFLGFDGYVSSIVNTYYLVGEWFLCPIIIIYVLYPLLNKFYRKNMWITGLVIFIIFLINDYYEISIQSSSFRSLISCITTFYLGMILHNLTSKIKLKVTVCIATLSIFMMVGLIPVIADGNISIHILGFLITIVLFKAGTIIMRNHICNAIVMWISKHSYIIFLIQHVIILYLRNCFFQANCYVSMKRYFFFLVICIFVILLCSGLIHCLLKKLMRICGFIKSRMQEKINV